MPRRVLLTGGAGYIGSVTAHRLVEAGDDVTVLDDLRSGRRDRVPEGARFVQGSVGDREAVTAAIGEGVDGCMHLAASIEVAESMRNAASFFENNTAGSLRLLDVLLEAGVSRFLLSSTAAVYGDPSSTPIEEDHPMRPTNAYGESKLLVERALAWMGRIHGLRYAILRYFNAAGATDSSGEDREGRSHLIPRLLDVAAGVSPHATVYGDDYPTSDGTCVRDFVHVADIADAHLLALDVLESKERVVCNLGSGRGFSVREVVESVRRVTGAAVPVEVTPRRPGDPAELVASNARAKEELGWAPAVTELDDIVSSAWAWRQRAR